ncbi:MAG: hypothetical protein K9I94_15240 [Bacteroidales bacterium]|nr:hypothetical protein [Bacteroidales bacterium]
MRYSKTDIYLGILILLTAIFISIPVYSQPDPPIDADPNTNGYELHWTRYMVLSPGYMGPNALPVPYVPKGTIEKRGYFQSGAEVHMSSGDQTQNLYAHFYLPIADSTVAIEAYGVPVERYHLDTATRYRRKTHLLVGEGYASGDVYFATHISLLKDRQKWPDMVLRAGIKTASGSKLSAARFTDSPGYFFDISFGKEKHFAGKPVNSIRWYGMLGFYSWQTHKHKHMQDDAFLYGGGLDISTGKYTFTNVLAGYAGYRKNEDQPLVYRFKIDRKIHKHKIRLQYQAGLNHYPYQSLHISFFYGFGN